jgi:hypothetical protein
MSGFDLIFLGVNIFLVGILGGLLIALASVRKAIRDIESILKARGELK